MKKSRKITLIVSGIVLTAGVLLFTLGGMLIKRNCEKNYADSLAFVAEPYPYAALGEPDDGVPFERDGIQLMMPADLQVKDDSDPESIKSRIFTNSAEDVTVMMMEPYDYGELMLADLEQKSSAKALAYFCKSIGSEIPQDWYAFNDLIYHMTLDDCNAHNVLQAYVFSLFAEGKAELTEPYTACWDLSNSDGDRGFVYLMKPLEGQQEDVCRITVQLFDRENGNLSHDVLIRAPEPEICWRIANSIRGTENFEHGERQYAE